MNAWITESRQAMLAESWWFAMAGTSCRTPAAAGMATKGKRLAHCPWVFRVQVLSNESAGNAEHCPYLARTIHTLSGNMRHSVRLRDTLSSVTLPVRANGKTAPIQSVHCETEARPDE
jgi:hypothetical protein